MSGSNPFTITFGKQPNTQINRYEDIDIILSTFTSENPVSQTFLIEGIRGKFLAQFAYGYLVLGSVSHYDLDGLGLRVKERVAEQEYQSTDCNHQSDRCGDDPELAARVELKAV